MTATGLSTAWPPGVPGPALANGVGFACSMVKASDVTDGLSNTFLIGEKNLWSDAYLNGDDGGDDEFALQGFDSDNYRFANDYSHCPGCTPYDLCRALTRTRPATTIAIRFGSAHLVGFNMALCDGSVRMVNYSDRLHDLQPPLQPPRRPGYRLQEGILRRRFSFSNATTRWTLSNAFK